MLKICRCRFLNYMYMYVPHSDHCVIDFIFLSNVNVEGEHWKPSVRFFCCFLVEK